jgi:prolyl 4-hydroxylase
MISTHSPYSTHSSQSIPNSTPNIPLYNGVNPYYPGLRVLNSAPPIFCVDHFLSPEECHFLIESASDAFTPAPVVGKGHGEISNVRTSSTCYLAREDVPDLMRKVSALTGKPMEHCELPQVGRYFTSQQYVQVRLFVIALLGVDTELKSLSCSPPQHFDAFNLDDEDGRRFAENGGQRTITVLLYLNDVVQGGETSFPNLNLQVQPRQGMALVFFPATIDGFLDPLALHAALPAVDTKYVSQIWIRQGNYYGQSSKRLSNLMGAPLTEEEVRNSGGGVGPITSV